MSKISRLTSILITSALAAWSLAGVGVALNLSSLTKTSMWVATPITAIAAISVFVQLWRSSAKDLLKHFIVLFTFGIGGVAGSPGLTILPMNPMDRLHYLASGVFLVTLGFVLARKWFRKKP